MPPKTNKPKAKKPKAAKKPKTKKVTCKKTEGKKLSNAVVAEFFARPGRQLKSTSQWTLANGLSLVVLKQDETLGTDPAIWKKAKQQLAQGVFMRLTLKKKLLRKDDPTQHVNLSTVMEEKGILSTPEQLLAALEGASSRKAKDLMKRYSEKEYAKKMIEDVLFELKSVLDQVEATSEKIDGLNPFATALTRICGLTLGRLKFAHRKYQLQLWGSKCEIEADVHIVRAGSDDLVVIFEHKSGNVTSENGGYVGQIFGEMLMMKQYNETNEKTHGTKDVYAIRLINHHVAFFKLRCTSDQLEVLQGAAKGFVPAPLPQLFCSHRPDAELGYDLLDEQLAQRRWRLFPQSGNWSKRCH